MADAGYSGTPLETKLGFKDGQTVAFVALPESLADLARSRHFAKVARCADWREVPDAPHDAIHLFTASAATVDAATPVLRDRIRPDGMIWVSWPKKASKVPTDVTEDVIRDRALLDVLVDVKVCAVDEIWSGLKLVVRKEARAGHKFARPSR
jgi:hypothetical protein